MLKGSAVYLFSNILNAAIPFALLSLLTRYLAPSEYGQLAMFQVLLGGLSAFVGLNVIAAASRKYYDNYLDDRALRELITSCLQIITVSGASVFVLINAVAESFFASLKKERVQWRHYQTRTEAQQGILDYIAMFYNSRRLHSALDYRSPNEFGSAMAELQKAA